LLVRKPDAASDRGHGRYCNILREIWVICRYNSKVQIVTDAFRTPSKLYPSHFILSISLIIAYWSFYPLLLTLQEDSGDLKINKWLQKNGFPNNHLENKSRVRNRTQPP